MEVILKESIAGLGYKDDIVTVKGGYGRNFLIPTKKAIVANESAKKVLAENLRQRAHKLAKEKDDAQVMASKISALKIVIKTKTSAAGKIFGSVTNIQIAEELAKAGYELDRRYITLKDGIKSVGKFEATVKLHKDVSAEISVEVVAE
jgi:large subunit ribosomal protein L9